MAIYTTYGSVRGSSGTKHRTREAAKRAVERDRRRCHKQGGYSDRAVAVIINGRLYHDENGHEPIYPSHGRSCGAAYA